MFSSLMSAINVNNPMLRYTGVNFVFIDDIKSYFTGYVENVKCESIGKLINFV